MLSVIMLARNAAAMAGRCLRSMYHTFHADGAQCDVEFILVDDASDAGRGVVEELRGFQGAIGRPCRVLQFTARQHYTRALSFALAVTRGEEVLFVSHDMAITPAYVETLRAVARSHASIGCVRGTSQYVDCYPHLQVEPSQPVRGLDDVFAFSRAQRDLHGERWEPVELCVGDSMLIPRRAIDRVGVLDHRYFGYFGDADWGLRAQRAGMTIVCARGAWLFHDGAGYYRDAIEAGGQPKEHVDAARMRVVNEAYRAFRAKWDPSLPEDYPGVWAIPYERIRAIPRPEGWDHVRPSNRRRSSVACTGKTRVLINAAAIDAV